LPQLELLHTRHRAFVDYWEFFYRHHEVSEEPSPEELMAYLNELAVRPKPPAHISFVPRGPSSAFILFCTIFFFNPVTTTHGSRCMVCVCCVVTGIYIYVITKYMS
jgi:hypothetical protein